MKRFSGLSGIKSSQPLDILPVNCTIPLRFVKVDLENALSIVHETRLYAYDAYFLDCALRHGAPLLTLDLTLRRAAVKLGVSVMGG